VTAGDAFEAARLEAEKLLAESCQLAIDAGVDGHEREAADWFVLARAADLILDAVRLVRASVAELQAGVRGSDRYGLWPSDLESGGLSRDDRRTHRQWCGVTGQ
jgi:hypothetical protein